MRLHRGDVCVPTGLPEDCVSCVENLSIQSLDETLKPPASFLGESGTGLQACFEFCEAFFRDQHIVF